MAILTNADSAYVTRSPGFAVNAPYTMMAWGKFGDISDQGWIMYAGYYDGAMHLDDIAHVSSKFYLEANNVSASAVASTTAIANNTWYHLAVVRESVTAIKFYLNGVLDITGPTLNVAGNSGSANFSMMGHTKANATLSHCKLWTAALSVAEIQNEMRSIRPIHQLNNLWAWYPMIAGT